MKFEEGYPYIGMTQYITGVVYSKGRVCIIDAPFQNAEETTGRTSDINEERIKNISKEYLTNTYGKVESEEHREFIIALAKNGGFGCHDSNKLEWFCFCDSWVVFWGLENTASSGRKKLITIPMPEISKKEESWPQVGDEFEYRLGESAVWNKAVVHTIVGTQGIVMTGDFCEGIQYCSYFSKKQKLEIRKPKNEEELLHDDIQKTIVDHGVSSDPTPIASILMDKYNISRKDKT